MKKLLCLTVLSAIVALPAFANTMNDDVTSSSSTTTESVKKSHPSSMDDGMQKMEEKKTTTESKDMKSVDQNGSKVDTTIKKRTEKSSY